MSCHVLSSGNRNSEEVIGGIEEEDGEKQDVVYKITSFYVRRPLVSCCSCFLFIFIVAIGGLQASLLTLSEPSEYDWTIVLRMRVRN